MSEPKVPESAIVSGILRWAHYRPDLFLWRNNTGGHKVNGDLFSKARFIRYGYPGSPDIIGVKAPDGQFIGIECKAAGNKLTERQQRFKEAFERHGGRYIVAYDIVDAMEALS